MNPIETHFRMQDGQMVMKEKGRFFDLIRGLKNGLYSITIEQVYGARSNPQNRYYWGVVIPAFVKGVSEEWGEQISQEEAHETLKNQFNYQETVNPETGQIIRLIRFTRKLSTVRFNEYIENCRRMIQEYFGIITPDPE